MICISLTCPNSKGKKPALNMNSSKQSVEPQYPSCFTSFSFSGNSMSLKHKNKPQKLCYKNCIFCCFLGSAEKFRISFKSSGPGHSSLEGMGLLLGPFPAPKMPPFGLLPFFKPNGFCKPRRLCASRLLFPPADRATAACIFRSLGLHWNGRENSFQLFYNLYC